MKKNDVKTIVLFIICILIIGILILYNNREKEVKDVNRKINYIFNTYTYENVLTEGKNLFFKAINLYDSDNFKYEKDEDYQVKLYNINDSNDYKHIINFNLLDNIYITSAVNEYMIDKKILKEDNNYFIPTYDITYNKDYIGSIIEVSKYDDTYIYFKSNNYYCSNSKYIGNLVNIPNCDFTMKESTFKVTLQNNLLLLTSYEDIKNIIA